MKGESILLVASRHASKLAITGEISALAVKVFGSARLFVPETENETGWPGSCNFMFSQALFHVERHFNDDMLWLEPDAIPLIEWWFDDIKDEWNEIGENKLFLGAYVQKSSPHMSGVAVYGRDWRKIAPSLASAPDNVPWDLHSAREVMPRALFTDLIQHQSGNPNIPSLDALTGSSVIFHQDKQGRLIELLGGGSMIYEEPKVMRKFYHAENANRRIRKNGHEFIFDKYDMFGGTWLGTYSTESENEIVALDAIVAEPRYGVIEMTQGEYEGVTKKKVMSSPDLEPLKAPLQLALNQSPAVLVEAPSPSPSNTPVESQKTIDEMLTLDYVKMENAEPIKKPRASRKKSIS